MLSRFFAIAVYSTIACLRRTCDSEINLQTYSSEAAPIGAELQGLAETVRE